MLERYCVIFLLSFLDHLLFKRNVDAQLSCILNVHAATIHNFTVIVML